MSAKWRTSVAAIAALAPLLAMPLATGSLALAASPAAFPFNHPTGIVASHGNLWITEQSSNEVTELAPSGATLRELANTKYGFHQPGAIAAAGNHIFVASQAGGVTELNATNGSLVRLMRNPHYEFGEPDALAINHGKLWVANRSRNSLVEISINHGAIVRRVSGLPRKVLFSPVALAITPNRVWVVDGETNAVTEVNAATGKVGRVLRAPRYQFAQPQGIAYDGSHLWVSDSASNSMTEFSLSGKLIQVVTNTSHNSNYGFDEPTAVVAHHSDIYVISPPGGSPMITRVNTNTSKGDWFECNTNLPDPYFYNPTGLTVLGHHVWVVSQSNNSVEELHISTGFLVNRWGSTTVAPS